MDRRRVREGNLTFAMTSANRKTGNENHSDESDDEFFDCDANNEDDEGKHHNYAPWNKPEGRLSKLNDMKLIDSDEYLYVPITQEPVPKTEDQLEDDAEVMLKLGPGSELRAQIMSASLLSDMESFKAANPNGKLEDFIRWYSPRDWIEDDETGKNSFCQNHFSQEHNKLLHFEFCITVAKDESEDTNQPKTGRLSTRMLLPGNTWQTVWEASKPVPARRQVKILRF